MKSYRFVGDVSKQLNQLCREEMKEKLLADILVDMQVCKLEGWDIKEYASELKELIENIK
jgi:hypothetical protein